MAQALGLRHRLVVPVPLLTPRLSSLWIHLVTPLSTSIARPLAEGLRNPVVCGDDRALRSVTAVEPNRRLELRAEMRLPGEATLELVVSPSDLPEGGTRLVQTARFKPRGLAGMVYWAAVVPFHPFVFRSLLKAMGRGVEGGRTGLR